MIDKFPAWLRHLLIVAGGAFGGAIVQAILAARGVTGVDWSTVLVDAANLTVVAVVTAAAALWGLPVTRQYGVGSEGTGQPADSGHMAVRLGWMLTAVLALVSLLLLASADMADARQRGPVMPVTVTAQDCAGTLLVSYSLATLRDRAMTVYLDDGMQRLELLEVSGRSGPNGQWQRVSAAPGGEGRLRWPGYARATRRGSHFAQARVIRTDRDRVVSLPAVITDGCPA